MQKFWKSVKIWQSYRQLKGGNFLRRSVVLERVKLGNSNLVRGVARSLTDGWGAALCFMLVSFSLLQQKPDWWMIVSVTAGLAYFVAVGIVEETWTLRRPGKVFVSSKNRKLVT